MLALQPDSAAAWFSLLDQKTVRLDQAELDSLVRLERARSRNPDDQALLSFALGKALGLQIIAEGVEKESELEMLRDEGCDYFQGFLKSAPLTAVQFQEFAAQQN